MSDFDTPTLNVLQKKRNKELMERFFNTAGPTIVEDHYTVALMERIDWDEIQHLIRSKRYFVLHAPRQTGKTSTLLAIMESLNQSGQYRAVYANIEGAQTARGDVTRGIPTVCSAISRCITHYLNDDTVETWVQEKGLTIPVDDRLTQMLAHWASSDTMSCILLLDEVDALVGDTLISLLRQLRAGYTQRPEAFPQSVVLCGVRDVRDYRIRQSDGEVITGGSAFNIKAASLRMGNFTENECRELLQQHTDETGQRFEAGIFPELWEDTRGQPWLVNALAHEMVWKDKSARDRSAVIDKERYFSARERLIQSRATHLDQLADKLQEERVQRVIVAVLSGEEGQENSSPFDSIRPDDQQYTEDLGLIVSHPWVRISNRIYMEIIPRELTWVAQTRILPETESEWYITDAHQLDMEKLLRAFQQFFREHSESWIERFDYKEAGPQLLLQAFLQRILNGGGRLHREYGLGRKRTDLYIEWPTDPEKGMYGPVQRVVLELKIQRGTLDAMLPQALSQTADYADRVGAPEAHLIFFNRNEKISWDEKIWDRHHSFDDKRWIHLWGC